MNIMEDNYIITLLISILIFGFVNFYLKNKKMEVIKIVIFGIIFLTVNYSYRLVTNKYNTENDIVDTYKNLRIDALSELIDYGIEYVFFLL